MQPHEHETKNAKHMVGAQLAVGIDENVDSLSHGLHIPYPYTFVVSSYEEIKPRVAETIAFRCDRDRSIHMGLSPHENSCTAVRERKDDFHARFSVSRRHTQRITPGVDHVAGVGKRAQPIGQANAARLRLAELNNVARNASTCLKRSNGNVKLLQPTAKQERKHPSQWSEEATPFAPRIQAILCSPFIKPCDSGINLRWIESAPAQTREVRHQSSTWRIHFDYQIGFARYLFEKFAADSFRSSAWSVQPWVSRPLD